MLASIDFNKIKNLREIALSLPYLSAQHYKMLASLNIECYEEHFSKVNNSKKTFIQVKDLAQEATLNNNIIEELIYTTTIKNINSDDLAYKLLVDTLRSLIFQASYVYENNTNLVQILDPELVNYLLYSDLEQPLKALHIFLAKIWLKSNCTLISNDSIIYFLHNNSALIPHWINMGFKPFAPSINHESLIKNLQNNHKFKEIEQIIILLINNVRKDLKRFFSADLYQDVVFIKEQLEFLKSQQYSFSLKLIILARKLFSLNTVLLLENFKVHNTNLRNLWVLEKFIDLVESSPNPNANHMLELALFINPNHNYLAYRAIMHGANPLNKVIKLNNSANEFKSFLEILIMQGRTAELLQIFNYYNNIYQAALSNPPLSQKYDFSGFGLNLIELIAQNYEHTPHNAEELIMNIFKYLASHDLIAYKKLAALDLAFLYPNFLEFSTIIEPTKENTALAHFINLILPGQTHNILKERLIANLLKNYLAMEKPTTFLWSRRQNTITQQLACFHLEEEPVEKYTPRLYSL